MEALIHIGMHKTGSTSIQQTLGRTPSLGPGFCYPRLGGRANHSLALHQMFSAEPERHQILRKQGMSRQQATEEGRALREELSLQLKGLAPACSPILSGEYLSSCDEALLISLRDFLHAHDCSIAVKAYVRDAADFMRSDFQQRIKGGAGDFDVEASYPRYRRRFEKVERVFGAASVQYWPFVASALAGGNVVTDFCHRIGLALPPTAELVRSNDSLSRTALALLFLYRRRVEAGTPSPEAFRRFRRVLQAIRHVPGPRFHLAKELLAPVISGQAEDLAWMGRRVGRDMGTLPPNEEESVRSEQHLLALGEQALEDLAKQLQVRRKPQGGPDIEIVIRRLMHEQVAQRRQAESSGNPSH